MLIDIYIMKEKLSSSTVLDWLLVDDLTFLFRVFYSEGQMRYPSLPFELFRSIRKHSSESSYAYRLMANLIRSYWLPFIFGLVLTLVSASLNIYLSQIFKDLIEVLKEGTASSSVYDVTKQFVLLQVLRLFFSTHVKKVFGRLAVQIESSIVGRLIEKVVYMSQKARHQMPDGEIYQYENVDIRHISHMVSTLSIAAEWPFTILVTIYLLFSLNLSLGFIAVFWFAIDVVLQRKLNNKRRHCNTTKHGLISKRAQFNYEVISRISEARVSHQEGVLIEKNNDLFLEECHDHLVFYKYSSMLEILQLLLPLAICCSTLLYDTLSERTITFQDLYFVLSLLGICYHPMAQFRTFFISWTDALHSFSRIGSFLQKEEESSSSLRERTTSDPSSYIVVAKKSRATVVNSRNQAFTFIINHHLQLYQGNRLVVLGRTGEGSTTIIRMLAGFASLSEGKIKCSGQIAYLPQEPMSLADSLYSNIAFFDSSITREQAHQMAVQLNLYEYLDASQGLDQKVEAKKYSDSQLRLLSLARVLCSKADIYILDSPFAGLTYSYRSKVEQQLRKRQEKGTIIVLAMLQAESLQPRDKVFIIEEGKTKEFGSFQELTTSKTSEIGYYLRKHRILQGETGQMRALRQTVRDFQNKVRKCMMIELAASSFQKAKSDKRKLSFIIGTLKQYSRKLLQQTVLSEEQEIKKRKEKQVWAYFMRFLTACRLSESALILIIILVAELLHTFIHVFIGHQYEHMEEQALDSMGHLVVYEVFLTIGLAAVVFLQGEVSSHLAVIIGNKLYSRSLMAITGKKMSWYSGRYSLRTADRFNHDYQEIFIFVHSLLSIYKHSIILLITVLLVAGKNYLVLLACLGVGVVYQRIWVLQKVVRSKALTGYYDLKYNYIKVFKQSLQNYQLIKVQTVQKEVIQKARDKYSLFVSYKIIKGKVALGEDILFSLVGIIVTAAALQYGLGSLSDRTSMPAAATSILLLLNLSSVLKTILRTIIACQKFFKLNILPFMKVAPLEEQPSALKESQQWKCLPENHQISMREYIAKDSEQGVFEINPFSLSIPQGQSICLYEEDDLLRRNLLYGLTGNLQTSINNQIRIGGVSVNSIRPEDLASLVAVITDSNFMIEGTLEENFQWKNPFYNQKLAFQLIKQVNLQEDLRDYSQLKLQTPVYYSEGQAHQKVAKKIAVIRAILLKSPIAILMDTHPFVDNWSIKDLLKKYTPSCTIIQITNSLEVALDVDRIILFEDLRKVEDGAPDELVRLEMSQVGRLLRQCDRDSFMYRYKLEGRRVGRRVEGRSLRAYPKVMRGLAEYSLGK